MSRPVTFPRGVAIGAAVQMLLKLPRPLNIDRGVIDRLTTDESMRPVWRELEQRKLAEDPDIHPLRLGQCLIEFFVCACVTTAPASQPWSRKKLKGRGDHYLKRAAVVREMAEELRAEEPLPHQVPRGLHTVYVARQLEEVAQFYAGVGNALLALASDGCDALIIDRRRAGDRARGYVQRLDAHARQWFSDVPPRVLATVANVALALPPRHAVGAKDVNNWRMLANKKAKKGKLLAD
jgi:hypothetical protein